MSKKKTTEEFICDAIKVHGYFYSYSNVHYDGAYKKVKIECKIHGIFEQTPHDHLNKKGCPTCGNIKRGLATSRNKRYDQITFLEKAKKIHLSRYDYSKSIYNGMTGGKITIICKIHGEFYQSPSSHLSGNGCSKCGLGNNSKIEKQWLDSHNINPQYRQFLITISTTNRFFVDGFCPETNTVYEFYGDFWHGNPLLLNSKDVNILAKKTFGELYHQTVVRENIIRSAGFNIITMWEHEYKSKLKMNKIILNQH